MDFGQNKKFFLVVIFVIIAGTLGAFAYQQKATAPSLPADGQQITKSGVITDKQKTADPLQAGQPITEFIGMITAKTEDALTVSRLILPSQNGTTKVSFEEETLKITRKTTLTLLAVNKEELENRNKAELDFERNKTPLPPTPPAQVDSTNNSPLFNEAPATLDDFVVGAKVKIITREDACVADHLTALALKLFPATFVITPFNTSAPPKTQ